MKALIFDIEGTTTDINFVHNILFPYAKKNIASFVMANERKLQDTLSTIKNEYGLRQIDEIVDLLINWIDEDKKIKELKIIQGYIWEDGYEHGEYKAHLYSDVLLALKKWKESGLDLYIYSSGSVYAQKLLFSHTEFGDLTPLFSGYFDTTIGGKKEASSYFNILNSIGYESKDVAFFTDNPDEVKAASNAGIKVFHVNRDGLYDDSKINMITSFDQAEV